ncbi:hypothetical protein PO81_08815, partial [Vibrio parahaemolyticus]
PTKEKSLVMVPLQEEMDFGEQENADYLFKEITYKDDILNTHNTFIPFNLEARECENPLFKSPKEPIIRVILGTNEDAFTQKDIETFLN